MPGFEPERAKRRLTSALIRLDFPTFDRPTSASAGRPSVRTVLPSAMLVTNSAERSFTDSSASTLVGDALRRDRIGLFVIRQNRTSRFREGGL